MSNLRSRNATNRTTYNHTHTHTPKPKGGKSEKDVDFGNHRTTFKKEKERRDKKNCKQQADDVKGDMRRESQVEIFLYS